MRPEGVPEVLDIFSIECGLRRGVYCIVFFVLMNQLEAAKTLTEVVQAVAAAVELAKSARCVTEKTQIHLETKLPTMTVLAG